MGRLKVAPPRLGRMPSRLSADRDSQGHSRTVEHWRGWYNLKRWRELRMRVFERDLFTCQRPECGRIEANTSLLVGDHIEAHQGNARLFWDERNVHTLCKPCHDKAKQAEEHRARFGVGHGARG